MCRKQNNGSVMLTVLIIFTVMALALHTLIDYLSVESQSFANIQTQQHREIDARLVLQSEFQTLANNNFSIMEDLSIGEFTQLSIQADIHAAKTQSNQLLLQSNLSPIQSLFINFTSDNDSTELRFIDSYWVKNFE